MPSAVRRRPSQLLPFHAFSILRKIMRGALKKTTRLSQWTGPQLPAHAGESWLTTLCQRDTLCRAGVVLLTTLALTALAYSWGWPLPYRIGEVWPHDVYPRVKFAVFDEART